jgi:hypothetical protein
MELRKQNMLLKIFDKKEVFALHNERFNSSVSQECTASSLRVTDLIQMDVKRMGGKKMCQLHRAV